MNHKTSSERMGEAMRRAMQHWKSRGKSSEGPVLPPAREVHPFTVAISREAGAHGTTLARALGERLGWAVYDKELVSRIAEEMGLRTQLVESVDEKQDNWLADCLEALSLGPTVSTPGYVHHLGETLLSLAAHGECVIVGRGAAQILPEATTLRIRMVAPLETRTEVIRQRKNLSRDEAKRWVVNTDRERDQFVRDYFRKDATDLRNYDLVLNTGRLSIEACVEIVLQALKSLQQRAAAQVAGS
jgi:cytidylate kinase